MRVENWLVFLTPFIPKYAFSIVNNSPKLLQISISAVFWLITLKILAISLIQPIYFKHLDSIAKLTYFIGISVGVVLLIIAFDIIAINIIHKKYQRPIDYSKGLAVISISSLPYFTGTLLLDYWGLKDYRLLAGLWSLSLIILGLYIVFNLTNKKNQHTSPMS